MLLVLIMMLVMVMMRHSVNPNPLSLSTPWLLVLIVAGAESSPVFFVPRAERLAAKHEIVVLNDCRYHPAGRAVEVDLAGGGLGDVEVRDDHVWLVGGPAVVVVVVVVCRLW